MGRSVEAVILAGGFGTRMRPLTYHRPKPLLPLLNRPLLAHILDALPPDVTKAILPVNYLREQIEAYFEEHPDPRVVLVEEKNPLGTGGAIKNCERHLTGPFFVYNGDIVASLPLEDLRSTHRAKRAHATISLWPVDEPWHFGVVELAPDGRITRFVEKPPQGQEPSNLINAGHYLLERDLLDHIPPAKFYSLEKELYAPMAQSSGRLYGHRFAGHWIDCGRPESLLEAHRTVLAARKQTKVIGDDSDISRGARVEGYAVGPNCVIAPGVRVERSVLMPRVQLGRNVTVRDCILGEGVEVEDGTLLERVVVGDYGVVEGGRTIRDQRIGMRAVDVEA
jgi:mannose-1-phosphate guanylyltransferase